MNYIKLLSERYPMLSPCLSSIEKAVQVIINSHSGGGKILLCGNGGSACDCEHISGELLKGFLSDRKISVNEYPDLDESLRQKLQKGVAAIPINAFSAALSAFSNDVDDKFAYAQLVFSLGKKDDVFIGISTSGNAANVINAAKTAKALQLKTIALTGNNGGELSKICDVAIKVPENETFKVQELHLPVYHAICAQIENILFGD